MTVQFLGSTGVAASGEVLSWEDHSLMLCSTLLCREEAYLKLEHPASLATLPLLAHRLTAWSATRAGGGNGVVWGINVSAPNPAATAKPVHFIAGEGEA